MQTGGCRQQTAGEQWVVPLWWIVHTGNGSVYPPGYTPSSPQPIQDFAAKLAAVAGCSGTRLTPLRWAAASSGHCRET
jgi:hypothetical protein